MSKSFFSNTQDGEATRNRFRGYSHFGSSHSGCEALPGRPCTAILFLPFCFLLHAMLSPGERKLASCVAFSMRLAKKLDLIHVRTQLSETLASLAHPQDMGTSWFKVPETCEKFCQTHEDIISRPVCEKLMMQVEHRAEGIILRHQQTMARQQAVIDQLQADLQKCFRDTVRTDGAEAHVRRDVKQQDLPDSGMEEACGMHDQAQAQAAHLLVQHRGARIAVKEARREERRERHQQQQDQEPLSRRARIPAHRCQET